MRATFFPGTQPIFVAGLGTLPGAISTVVDDYGFVYVVDDRRAGEPLKHDGQIRGEFVTFTRATHLLLGTAPAPSPLASPVVGSDAAAAPPSTPEPEWITTAQAAERLGIHRATLDRILEQAPSTLTGAPVNVGHGKNRRHLRWNAAELNDWYHAYQEWKGRRGRRR